MVMFVVFLARTIYFTHPYYVGFISLAAVPVLSAILWGILILAVLDALRNFLFIENIAPTKFTLIFGLFLKVIYNLRQWVGGQHDYVKLEVDKTTKVALLAMLVKFIYIPIMINFLVGNFQGLQGNITAVGYAPTDFDVVYNLLVTAVFTVDTFIFTFGYLVESPYLGSKIRSVEPTVLGWVSALATYPPFNGLTSTFFIMVDGGTTVIGQNITMLHAVRIAILICDFLFVACSVSLGFKASNLTNRGIVKHGPYSVVRHPAYTVKLLSWFLEGVIFAPGIGYFLGWAGFAFVYFMRAITEERHLSQDPDYVDYKQQVKYRFIPGVA